MKILHLTLKKKWFDMIASGEKKEEYREIKPYWASRLVDEYDGNPNPREDESWDWKGLRLGMGTPQHYDIVKFRNGYSANSPTISLKVKDIKIWSGKCEWGAEFGKKYFVISLGEIIK
jgi:hypothetical protein